MNRDDGNGTNDNWAYRSIFFTSKCVDWGILGDIITT